MNRKQAPLCCLGLNNKQAENATMERKQAAKRKSTSNVAAATALGAAGLGLSLVGSAPHPQRPVLIFRNPDHPAQSALRSWR